MAKVNGMMALAAAAMFELGFEAGAAANGSFERADVLNLLDEAAARTGAPSRLKTAAVRLAKMLAGDTMLESFVAGALVGSGGRVKS